MDLLRETMCVCPMIYRHNHVKFNCQFSEENLRKMNAVKENFFEADEVSTEFLKLSQSLSDMEELGNSHAHFYSIKFLS